MQKAGIYIHIPFCRRKCTYCNFHFSTNFSLKDGLLEALHMEISQKIDTWRHFQISSIYFGGGTPSILTMDEISIILNQFIDNAAFDSEIEITFEANPEDLSLHYLQELLTLGINRLSIGVQSFKNDDLRWMNRNHSQVDNIKCIENVKNAGFKNFSIDLIYGIPGLSDSEWSNHLASVSLWEIPHFSAYALTVEPKTKLFHDVNKKKYLLPGEEKVLEQMDILLDFCEQDHYEPYEISNFAKEGYRAIHNSNYWKGLPYFGFGPSAHSFDGSSRSWNIADNIQYIQALTQGLRFNESEVLSKENKFNEYLMLNLRKIEGVDLDYIKTHYSEYYEKLISQLNDYKQKGLITSNSNKYMLTRAGKHIADRISSDIFTDI
ncbi:MAG: radical SAM family heme chaperone HemW [Bacteroidota bacterium]|nr:radical SAM family heme chaperone HemW [Bacteroidota bacterium]